MYKSFLIFFTMVSSAITPGLNAQSVDLSRPIVGTGVVFNEENGIVAVEAEHFYKQTKTDLRQWYITSKGRVPDFKPDPDGEHIAGASGNAYIEILPDTRRTPSDKLIKLEDPNLNEETARLVNFTDLPGKIAILYFKVNINQPGRYYVWVRAHSTGPEDNSLHVGFNETWPENGQRMQWCDGKNQWTWESKQRTEKEHCGVPKEIYLDIKKPGIQDIRFSMREDGFEFDKFILAKDINYIPEGEGPAPKLFKGTLPELFPKVAHRTDLINRWDTIRPLANPDKGWYHHLLDNGIHKYLIQDEKDLTAFPGMDHLYLRLAWAFLEPEEGKFDWSYIDNIVEKYVPMGYKISFRISCKETGKVNEAVPVEIDGIRYATPYWVVKAGAKGIDRPEFGSASWTPDWDDPVYLEKLDNFHKAFSGKYDGKPWVRYIDVGSIGDWGEGHTWSSTRIPPTFNEVKTHIDLYLKHYKHTQLIVTDDLLASTKSDTEKKELLNYALENGFSLRDDSPMVQGYMQNELNTWTVRHPEFFEEVYKIRPTVFELEHYGKVKSNGYWLGKNGEGIIPEYKVKGADVFRNAVKIIRPTYVGFHGYLGEWLTDNPEFTKEMLNMCGYWYFPKSINVTQAKGHNLSFEIDWLNKGVAPAYNSYQLRGILIPKDSKSESIEFVIEDCGNKRWMPGVVSAEKYTVTLSGKPKGEYSLAIQLFDMKSDKPVEIGLIENLKNEGYFLIQKIAF